MKREFLQNLKVGEQALPKEIVDAIMAENGKDIQAAKQEATVWEEKYNRAVESHSRQMRRAAFEAVFSQAVKHCGGRNEKAIAALLDMEALEHSDEQESAVISALDALKKEHDYLFAGALPPPFAAGTGSHQTQPAQPVQSLAGALRERFSN